MDQLAHHLDVLESRLTMDDASYGSDTSCASHPSPSTAEDDAAAADAFREFVYTSPKPGLQLPSTPLSALRSLEKKKMSSAATAPTDTTAPASINATSPLPPSSPMDIGLSFPPISPISLNAPPPSPIGLLDLSAQQKNGILSINTAITMPQMKQDTLDYDQFLSAAAGQPLSPARPGSSCSMTNSLSSSSLSSLSTSASYGSSLASYASGYGAPPNTFPYNLASRPESPAAQAQPIPAPIGLNPAHVNPGLLLASPTKTSAYPHLQPGPAPTLSLNNNQDGRTPSPIPSPTSASAAITLIDVGASPHQQVQYGNSVRPTTPQTPVSATAALSLCGAAPSSSSNPQFEDARAETQLQASAKRRREQSEQGIHLLLSSTISPSSSHHDNIPIIGSKMNNTVYSNIGNSGSALASPSKRSANDSPEKRRSTLTPPSSASDISSNSSGGSGNSTGSNSAKGGSNKTEIWPDDVEAAFMEALRVIPKLGRRKVMINGKPCGRNELIADYIRRKTFKIRSRKQVSSHIQVLKNLKRNDQEFMNLVTESMDDIEGFPAALLQAGFHMAQIPCLKTDLVIPNFTTLGAGLPSLGQLAASPLALHQAMAGNQMYSAAAGGLANSSAGGGAAGLSYANNSSQQPLTACSDTSFEALQQQGSTTASSTMSTYPSFYFNSFGNSQNQPSSSTASMLSQQLQDENGTPIGSMGSYQNGHGMLGPALYENDQHSTPV